MSKTPGSQNSTTEMCYYQEAAHARGKAREDIGDRWGLSPPYPSLPTFIRKPHTLMPLHTHRLTTQIMPSAKRATGMLENDRTSSYHIHSIVACQRSAKSSSSFKLVGRRDGGTKRYDFEADNPKVASEIVQNMRSIKNAVERSGTFRKSRKSEQVI